MSQPSTDARAVVRAIDALTTQVRRAVDRMPTPVIQQADDTDDDATTPTDDGPCAQHPHAPTFNGLCGGCTQYPADMRQTPAADEEQLLRWARRESLLVLLTRVQHGRTLTEDEARTLRHHIETEMRGADAALERARKAERAVDLLADSHRRADLADAVTAETKRLLERRTTTLRKRAEQAEAAIERVRALPESWEQMPADRHVYIHEAARTVRAALDGTEQPKTEGN